MTQVVEQRIEEQGLWWAFHKHLIIEIFEWLRDRLGDAYLVDLEGTVLLISRVGGPARSLAPDVSVTPLQPIVKEAGQVLLEPTPALIEVDQPLEEFEQYTIQIRRRDLPDPTDPFGSRVISVVELVSPSNKGLMGTSDRRKFLAKRHDYLATPVGYTEIDLLSEGSRDLPQPVEQLENYPYMVWASQVQVRTRHHWGWGWYLNEPLPLVTLPLEYPHVHVLDLGACYGRAYADNRWPLRLGD